MTNDKDELEKLHEMYLQYHLSPDDNLMQEIKKTEQQILSWKEKAKKYDYLMSSELPINHSFTFKTIQELEQKIKQLEEENRGLKELNNGLNDSCESLEKQVEERDNEFNKASNEYLKLKKQNQNCKQVIDEIRELNIDNIIHCTNLLDKKIVYHKDDRSFTESIRKDILKFKSLLSKLDEKE